MKYSSPWHKEAKTMHKILTLIKREYKEAVFKKSFIILTILAPVLMVGLALLPTLLLRMESEEMVKINIIDRTDMIYSELKSALDDTMKDGRLKYQINNIELPSAEVESVIEEQKEQVQEQQIDGLLLIPADVMQNNRIEYYAKNVANFDINNRLKGGVRQIVHQHRIQESGLDPLVIAEVTHPIAMNTIKITKSGQESERGFMEEYFSTFVFVFILYITLIMYGTSIMRGILEEKNTRIVEILLSSANPFQLMGGKILGLGSVGLTQYILWAMFGIALILFGGDFVPISQEFFNISPMIFVYFVVFYILGYFVYAVLYAAVGAITNSEQEAQQIQMPVIFLLIVPLMMIGMLVKNPDSTLITVLSHIPFFAPILMFARINLSDPGLIQIFASIIIMIVTITISIWIVAKIYRVGILMYGKRPNLPEIMKWLRYK
ncbi:MAG: ABC transporter permease subunit [Caldithrix sp.]|nr:ABC transporter permease subunit [Caldithrix sp.]